MMYEVRKISTVSGDRYQVWRVDGDSVSCLFSTGAKAEKFMRSLINQSNVDQSANVESGNVK